MRRIGLLELALEGHSLSLELIVPIAQSPFALASCLGLDGKDNELSIKKRL